MICFHPEQKTFTLLTRSTAYQMQIGPAGYLLHLYYGRRSDDLFDYLYLLGDHGFCPNPYELRRERNWSADLFPQEYSGANTGDFRVSALNPVTENGVWGTNLSYLRHEITEGKYALDTMPSASERNGPVQTLSVTLEDAAAGIEVELLYGVFEEQDVITRAARIRNTGTGTVCLHKAASACLDIPFGTWDEIHFYGRHAMEMHVERSPLHHGIQTVSSLRGASSHQYNPFVIVCDHASTEDSGECYGIMPVYSGSHRTDMELDQMGSVRIVTGIHDSQFLWKLTPGACFETPEILFAFTHQGLSRLSHIYHRFIRNHLCRKTVQLPRPVLLNNWEATYFHFNTEKLLEIARRAKALGVDLLVLDDGWFGRRNDDNSGLGDWYVNESKLPGGLNYLIEQVNGMGLKFGLWVEPEMVNEDSDLYRAHPEWALTVPGRAPAMCRNQLVLDLSRQDVVDWLFETFSNLLRNHHIEYIKWDMNRNLTDLYSHDLPADQQGEVAHRYVMGLYRLLDRLTTAFPDVLFEGCSGGGGRFDAGMLAYSPQIWCSDNTDAIDRLNIQYGTSFGYPMSAVGAHVSAIPNHQTGRTTPIGTRAIVAMAGTFGYELDPQKLSPSDEQEMIQQIARFREYDALMYNGDYYRLAQSADNQTFTAWEFVSSDASEALISVVVTHTRANPPPMHLKFKGLEENAVYTLRLECFGHLLPPDQLYPGGARKERTYSGAALMYGGYTLPALFGDYPGAQIYLKKLPK